MKTYTDIQTPTDKRTWQYKQLAKRVKEMKIPYYKTKWGIWAYLRVKDMHNFTNDFIYNVN